MRKNKKRNNKISLPQGNKFQWIKRLNGYPELQLKVSFPQLIKPAIILDCL